MLHYFIEIFASNTKLAHSYITPPVFQVELEKDGWELMDMLWCQGSQNIGLANRKLKSALKCTV